MKDSQTSIQPVHLSRFTALTLFLLVFAWHNNLQAASNEDNYPRNYELGIEYFQWEEFDSAGKRLLSETGPRIFLGFTSSNTLPFNKNVYAIAKARLYIGNIDYNGQTQSGIFSASTSRYSGWNTELLSGWRILPERRNTLLIAALGAEGWQRNIDDTFNAQGGFTLGIKEDYQTVYTRLGLGFEQSHKHGKYSLKTGFKRPLWTDEQVQVTGLNLTLEPGKQWSFFANYQLNLYAEANKQYIFKAYFDSYRFSASPVVNNFLQPESTLDTFGVSFGSSF